MVAKCGEVKIEMFNSAFFSLFPRDKMIIEVELQKLVLEKLTCSTRTDENIHSLLESLLKTVVSESVKPELQPQGYNEKLDLYEIFDRLNNQYFGGKVKADVKWGGRYGKNNRCTVRYGSYDDRIKLIRVNPVLAKPQVPREILEMTVHHEMCHQACPPIRRAGRWLFHHDEFKKKEREYSNYDRVTKWENANWTRLLKS